MAPQEDAYERAMLAYGWEDDGGGNSFMSSGTFYHFARVFEEDVGKTTVIRLSEVRRVMEE